MSPAPAPPLRIGRPSVLREANALRTLELLRASGSISRAHLARSLGLSAPTITSVVRDLLSAGLVEELGDGPSSGGRPPGLLRFRGEHGCLLAAQFTRDGLRLLLTDLEGRELASVTEALPRHGKTPTAIAARIAELTRRLMREERRPLRRLVAAVVGAPAIVDVDRGTVLSVSTLEGWRSVPLQAMLAKLLPCLVIVENDTNLAACGERFRGAGQGNDSFVLVNIGANVSAGILLDGRIHHGAQFSAGEVGYLRLPHVSRRSATLHQFGAVEEILTAPALERAWAEGETRKDSTAPRRSLSAAAILDLALERDARAMRLVRTHASLLSDLLLNLSLILNPGLILLDGTIGRHPAVTAAVEAQLATNEFGVPRLLRGTLGDSATLWGAIALGLERAPAVLVRSL